MGLHLAVASPLDVRRLADELSLEPVSGTAVPVGHGGHSVTELVLSLAPLVDQLDLITLDPTLAAPLELRGGKFRCSVGPLRRSARSRGVDFFAAERAFIADRLQHLQPDVVSAHWTYEYALGALDSGNRVLITVRDWAPTILRHEHDAYRAMRLIMQFMTFARGREFAAVSPYMARKVERFTRRACGVLPNALGSSWFDHEATTPSGKVVLAVNNGFGRRKNVQSLLRAWPLVLEREPTAELLLVGSGYEFQGAAYRWAMRRGLAEAVRFLGSQPREQLPGLLRSSSVFAHPALEESFGMVVLEAMAMGVPVLGGQAGGAVPWLLADGAGVLVDVRRPRLIADGIVRLLAEAPLAESTARQGFRRAREQFSGDNVAAAYINRLSSLGVGSG